MPIIKLTGLQAMIKTVAIIVACSLPAIYSPQSQATTKEDKVKAAIVYKLTKFITWPDKKKTLALCIIGRGSVNQELMKINHKFSLGRRISVTHKAPSAPLGKLCDLVYIHNSDTEIIQGVVGQLNQKPVLTISDIDSFASQGGIVGLYRTGSRIRFAISQGATKSSGLQIDSQLMGMAKRMK